MKSNKSCILIIAPVEYVKELIKISKDLKQDSSETTLGRITYGTDRFVCLVLMQDEENKQGRSAFVKNIMSTPTFSKDIRVCISDIHIDEDDVYHVDSMHLCKARCGLLANWLNAEREQLFTLFLNEDLSADAFCRIVNNFVELPYPVSREVFNLMRQNICNINKE